MSGTIVRNANAVRSLVLMLGLLAAILQQLAPLCMAISAGKPGTAIVLCTAAGLQTVIVHDAPPSGSPEREDHSSACTLCASSHSAFVLAAPGSGLFEAFAADSTDHVSDSQTASRLFWPYASRAPPRLSA
jgi:hypothetical protein